MDFYEQIEADARRIFALPDRVGFFYDGKFEGTQLGACAFVEGDDTFIDVVFAKNITIEQFMVTLCHEIVHVHQIVDGRLKAFKTGSHQFLFCDELVNATDHAYRDLPWEKEAFEKQADYLKMFCRECSKELYNEIVKAFK